jgi:hypothetical protein
VDALLQRGALPGRTVGRKWRTTTTAVLQWPEQSAAPDRRAGDDPGARDGPRQYGRPGGVHTDRVRAARHQGPARRAVRPCPGRCHGVRSSADARARCHSHSEADGFVSCCVRAGPVFCAMVFPDEPNAPDDRALSWREMSPLHGMTWWCGESTGLQHLRGHDVREGSRGRHMGILAVDARHLSTTCAVSCMAPTDGGIFPGKLLS